MTALGTLQDVTERKQMEAALQRLLDALAHGNPEQACEVGLTVAAQEAAVKELQLAEHKYRTLAEQLPLVTYIDRVDDASSAVYMSPQIERILGYPVEDWLTDTDLFVRLLHPEDRERVLAEVAEANETGNPFSSEYRLIAKDGRVVCFRDECVHEFDENGRPTIARGYMMDITEDKEADLERALLVEQLHQSQKMEAVGRLAGGVAHDFNNLLTVIMSYAEFLRTRVGDDSPLGADVEEIEKAARRAGELTRQLLAFSRGQVLQPKVIDLNAAVTGMSTLLGRLIGEDVQLETTLAADLGPVNADPSQIEQVLMNLAVNARDAMRNGGKLVIETANVEIDQRSTARHPGAEVGSHVLLTVSDTGCGMDAETLASIFEPFFTTKPQGEGTGLGLSTVYGIVKQSGGSIWADSEPGQGTTFKIYLPRVQDPLDAPAQPLTDGQPAPQADRPGRQGALHVRVLGSPSFPTRRAWCGSTPHSEAVYADRPRPEGARGAG